MDRAFFSLYDRNARPCREQNLFINLSKHLYCLNDGTLKYQKKSLDPRIPGKKLITRFVLLDVDTGYVYGECHDHENDEDLAGFLARAWIKKPLHAMHGIPSVLNVPSIALKNERYHSDLDLIARSTGLTLGDLPSGFAAGVHAVKQFEAAVETLLWAGRGREPASLYIAQACSGVLSAQASSTMSHLWEDRWNEVPVAPDHFFAEVDALYKEPGAWREAPFSFVLDGLPNHSQE